LKFSALERLVWLFLTMVFILFKGFGFIWNLVFLIDLKYPNFHLWWKENGISINLLKRFYFSKKKRLWTLLFLWF
jgi:hypothetical protein